ncbi:unnamed protein product [Gordionus sp. m RMFG-2023]
MSTESVINNSSQGLDNERKNFTEYSDLNLTIFTDIIGSWFIRQVVTNIFITNLAVSDIMMSVLCVPFTPLYSFIGSWVFGSFLCRVLSMAQCMSVYLSALTLTDDYAWLPLQNNVYVDYIDYHIVSPSIFSKSG